jgi:hypothetical protein
LFSLSLLGQTQKKGTIRYDGIYQTVTSIDTTNSDTTRHFLRFYPNGKVISVGSTGTVLDLEKWFNINHKDISVGNFEITEKRIYFSTTSSTGTVIYDGLFINKYYLELNIKSLINNYTATERYYFIKIPELK